jgi:predicted kinase
MPSEIFNDFILDNSIVDSMTNANHGVTNKDLGISENPHHIVKGNPYHLEGSTYSHTLMVYNQIKDHTDMMDFLTLHHDLGKPLMRTYKADKGKVHMIGHDVASAYLSISRAKKYFSDDQVIDICKHIVWHQSLYQNGPELLEDLFDTFPAYLEELSRCDDMGRVTSVPRGEKPVIPSVSTKDTVDPNKSTLYIPVAIPGAGKSTIMKEYCDVLIAPDEVLMELANEQGITRYDDAFRWWSENKIGWVGLAKNRLQDHMKYKGTDIVYDATNLSNKSRRSLYNVAQQNGYNTVVVHLWRDYNECKASRTGDDKNISEGVYKQMFGSYTYPRRSTYDKLIHRLV